MSGSTFLNSVISEFDSSGGDDSQSAITESINLSREVEAIKELAVEVLSDLPPELIGVIFGYVHSDRFRIGIALNCFKEIIQLNSDTLEPVRTLFGRALLPAAAGAVSSAVARASPNATIATNPLAPIAAARVSAIADEIEEQAEKKLVMTAAAIKRRAKKEKAAKEAEEKAKRKAAADGAAAAVPAAAAASHAAPSTKHVSVLCSNPESVRTVLSPVFEHSGVCRVVVVKGLSRLVAFGVEDFVCVWSDEQQRIVAKFDHSCHVTALAAAAVPIPAAAVPPPPPNSRKRVEPRAPTYPVLVSGGVDGTVKVWALVSLAQSQLQSSALASASGGVHDPNKVNHLSAVRTVRTPLYEFPASPDTWNAPVTELAVTQAGMDLRNCGVELRPNMNSSEFALVTQPGTTVVLCRTEHRTFSFQLVLDVVTPAAPAAPAAPTSAGSISVTSSRPALDLRALGCHPVEWTHLVSQSCPRFTATADARFWCGEIPNHSAVAFGSIANPSRAALGRVMLSDSLHSAVPLAPDWYFPAFNRIRNWPSKVLSSPVKPKRPPSQPASGDSKSAAPASVGTTATPPSYQVMYLCSDSHKLFLANLTPNQQTRSVGDVAPFWIRSPLLVNPTAYSPAAHAFGFPTGCKLLPNGLLCCVIPVWDATPPTTKRNVHALILHVSILKPEIERERDVTDTDLPPQSHAPTAAGAPAAKGKKSKNGVAPAAETAAAAATATVTATATATAAKVEQTGIATQFPDETRGFITSLTVVARATLQLWLDYDVKPPTELTIHPFWE